ncbi:metalloregulator ArsR/SmtB family transcription factor [Thalassotalea ponticola]|uniref:metalloregulator ArsR/SmtB family transcription factor n=1 Tax=Thalassotalea ponticola TaxID=1523392 RepID=UPI0025B5BF67|nr:metalloregulator ArsR/SmtB family transcription factor [Thalassotalea ponticola]MDN3652455.1 metalloregulator ArsR/SmtB family transcription factor [Thalassotalea ponticola]
MITMVEFYKALADDTRLHALLLILAEGELCVCELGEALGCSQPKVSRHLARLKQDQLVIDRKQQQWVFYRLNPLLPTWCSEVLTTSLSCKSADFTECVSRLTTMKDRPQKCC